MAKNQNYTIVFNSPQNSVEDAFDTVSSALDSSVSSFIGNGFIIGDIQDISESLSSQLSRELSIPEFRLDENKPESLNVATTTAIFLSELNRNKNKQ